MNPNSTSDQAIGKYEGRQRHLRICVASGNKEVLHGLKKNKGLRYGGKWQLINCLRLRN